MHTLKLILLPVVMAALAMALPSQKDATIKVSAIQQQDQQTTYLRLMLGATQTATSNVGKPCGVGTPISDHACGNHTDGGLMFCSIPSGSLKGVCKKTNEGQRCGTGTSIGFDCGPSADRLVCRLTKGRSQGICTEQRGVT